MKVFGQVKYVKQLEPKDGGTPLTVVSVEGLSLLVKKGLEAQVPDGGYIEGAVSVQYRKGKSPNLWLESVEVA